MDKVKAYYKPAPVQGLRGVEVGDVLGMVTFADGPDKLEWADGLYPLFFSDNSRVQLDRGDDGHGGYYHVVTFFPQGVWNMGVELARNDWWDPPTSWNHPSFDFGNLTVSSLEGDPSKAIQNVIKIPTLIEAPLTPVKPYLYRPATGGGERGVEVGDVLGVVTLAGSPKDLQPAISWDTGTTLITFADGSYLELYHNEGSGRWEVTHYSGSNGILGGCEGGINYQGIMYEDVWSEASQWFGSFVSPGIVDFGGSTVATIHEPAVQSVIKAQAGAPALIAPLTAYFVKKEE